MNATNVGAKIAERRKELGMTQVELAEKLHVTNKAVSKWENGKNFPDLSLIESIATALDMSVVELLGLEEKTVEEAVLATADISENEKRRIRKEMKGDIAGTILLSIIILVLAIYVTGNIHPVSSINSALTFMKLSAVVLVVGNIRLAVRFVLSNKEVLSKGTVKMLRSFRTTVLVIMLCCIAVMAICAIASLCLVGVIHL